MSIKRAWFQVTVFLIALAPLVPIATLGDSRAAGANASSVSTTMGSEHQGELLARAEGPISLRSAPVSVKLAAKRAEGALSAAVRRLAPGQRIYLVTRNPHADAPPGVVYHIYLDLSPGARPGRNDPHYVGSLNFYAFTNPAGSGISASGSGRFRSFDITRVAIDLEQRNLLSIDTTITIAPARSPLANANATIGQIDVVRQ
jgi:hypothetical protein